MFNKHDFSFEMDWLGAGTTLIICRFQRQPECSTWNRWSTGWYQLPVNDRIGFELDHTRPSEKKYKSSPIFRIDFFCNFLLKLNVSIHTFPSTGLPGFFIISAIATSISLMNLSAMPSIVCIKVTQMWMLKRIHD